MMEAYSEDTGTRYPSWEALVAAESNGWVVVGMAENGGAAVYGPYDNKADAIKTQSRLRYKWKRELYGKKFRTVVRPLWKP